MGLLLSVSPPLSGIVGSNFFVASHLYLQGKKSIPTTAKLKLWFKSRYLPFVAVYYVCSISLLPEGFAS